MTQFAAKAAGWASKVGKAASSMGGDVLGSVAPAVRKGWAGVEAGAAAFESNPSGLMQRALKFTNSPTAVAVMMAPLGLSLLRKITKSVREAHEQDQLETSLLWQELEQDRRDREDERKATRLRLLAKENQRRMAMYAPHLFNQLSAGRILPRDAVVLGGEPRTDLLQEVAMKMARGQLGIDQPLDDPPEEYDE